MTVGLVVGVVAGGMLAVAALLTLVRIVRGPGMLDRVVAMDVLVSITVCALGVEAAVNRHTTTVPILVALSLVGFVGSVGVARFAARDHDADEADGAGEAGDVDPARAVDVGVTEEDGR